jgi:hypothetical protein
MEISFFESLNLDKYNNEKLKLVFHKDWNYDPNNSAVSTEEIEHFGAEARKFNLAEMYRFGEKDKIEFMMTLTGNKRLNKDEVAFSFIPYIYGKNMWLLAAAFKVKTADGRVVLKEDLAELKPYLGRMVILYSNKGANITLADIDKIKKLEVAAILDVPLDKTFPGYDKVRLSYTELEGVINTPEWEEKLSAKKGVYVIADKKTGQLYIGSAYGNNGIFGRWKTYIDSKGDIIDDDVSYPNQGFKEIVKNFGKDYIKENFQYSIIETFEIGTPEKEIIARESYWKNVLLTREHGYNKN